MYDIYTGDTIKGKFNLLFTFSEKEHTELFVYMDTINYNKHKMLNEIKNYNETVNFSYNEIILLKKELNFINSINKNIGISIALEKACNEAIKNGLELICSGEK